MCFLKLQSQLKKNKNRTHCLDCKTGNNNKTGYIWSGCINFDLKNTSRKIMLEVLQETRISKSNFKEYV